MDMADLADRRAGARPAHQVVSPRRLFSPITQPQLEDIHLQAARGTVAGSAAYNFDNHDVTASILRGHSIDLADIPEMQTPRLQIAGIANFTVKGSGTLEHPVINGHLQIGELVLNGDPSAPWKPTL